MAKRIQHKTSSRGIKIILVSPVMIVIAAFFVFANTPTPRNFLESKEILIQAWKKHNFTLDFYCQAPFTFINNDMVLLPNTRYLARKHITNSKKKNIRANKIEFEHIMPAHNFGKHLPCWRKGGRKACKNDIAFNKMESDLYNLVPVIGEINGDRSNYRYAEAPRDLQYTQYGNCKVYTDFKSKRFYPADYSKGLIARTYLYMSKTYNINLSHSELKLMQAWDKMYPPNEYEIKRNEIIKDIMFWRWIASARNLFNIT